LEIPCDAERDEHIAQRQRQPPPAPAAPFGRRQALVSCRHRRFSVTQGGGVRLCPDSGPRRSTARNAGKPPEALVVPRGARNTPFFRGSTPPACNKPKLRSSSPLKQPDFETGEHRERPCRKTRTSGGFIAATIGEFTACAGSCSAAWAMRTTRLRRFSCGRTAL